MPAAVSDAIIIGSVLVMVFGALFYYLYSRVLHNEKRMSVMENILLDIKMATDTVFASPPSDHRHADSLQESRDEFVPLGEAVVASQQVVESAELPPLEQPQEEQKTVVSMNYESMNIKELQHEARTRSIPGVSGLRRKELIEQLRKSDGSSDNTVQGSSLSLDTFVESAAEVPQ
jgi:hypothetical protein